MATRHDRGQRKNFKKCTTQDVRYNWFPACVPALVLSLSANQTDHLIQSRDVSAIKSSAGHGRHKRVDGRVRVRDLHPLLGVLGIMDGVDGQGRLEPNDALLLLVRDAGRLLIGLIAERRLMLQVAAKLEAGTGHVRSRV
jgi:hypothetical protein